MFVLVVLPKETWKPLGRVFGDDPTDTIPDPLLEAWNFTRKHPYPT